MKIDAILSDFLGFIQKVTKKKQTEVSNVIFNAEQRDLIGKLASDCIEEHETYMKVGNYYVRTLVVADYSSTVEAGFLNKLHNYGANVSVVHHISPTTSNAMKKDLDMAVKELKSRKHGRGVTESEFQEIDEQIEDAKGMIKKIIKNNSKVFYEHMLIHIQAESLEKLDRVTDNINTVIENNLSALAVKHRMRDSFFSVLPLNKNQVIDISYRNFDAEALSSLFPLDESEIMSKKGIINGKNTQTKNVVSVDPDELINKHEFVVAPSGSGKSTYLWGSIFRRWVQGVKIRVVDPKGEFGAKFEMVGGEWIKISLQSEKRINPFEIMNTQLVTDENGNLLNSSLLQKKISNLKTLFSLMYPALKDDPVRKSLLEKALIRTYAENERENEKRPITWTTDFSDFVSDDYPTLGNFYMLLESLIKEEEFKPLSGLYQVLYPYVEGTYAKALNGTTNVNLTNDLITFDLFDLLKEEELLRVVMYNILTFLFDDAVMDQEPVQIYVDEAQKLTDQQNNLGMKFLADSYQMLRSFNTGITTATTQIGNLLSAVEGSRNYGEAIILNSMSKFYLPMMEAELNMIMEKTSETFSEEEQNILKIKDPKRVNAGKGIFILGSNKVAMTVDLSPLELQIWDPKRFDQEYGHMDPPDDILLQDFEEDEDPIEEITFEPSLVS